jgi:hypothetical protein
MENNERVCHPPITAGSGLIPEPNGEAGDKLERCVKRGHGIM